MRLSYRLSLLIVLLTLLPALPAAWVSHQLFDQILNLGLNSEVDGALEAGLRRARRHLTVQRDLLERDLVAWVEAARAGDLLDDASMNDLLLAVPAPSRDGDRVTLTSPEGAVRVMHPGAPPPAPGPDETAVGAPPARIAGTLPLAAGWTVRVERPLSESWRDDAALLAGTLQNTRGLRSVRREFEKGFWLAFLLIYGFALLVGLVLAVHLGQGITGPVKRLLAATESVTAGDRRVAVPVSGRDEIGRLGEGFNTMVRTLDAQSRHLVDLEKMAGWREMARALAHEVKNPLTPIQLTVEEIRARYEGDDPEYRRLLEECTRIIIEEVKSLRNIVTRFREFSRPVEPKMSEVDVNGLLADVAALQMDLRVELDLADHVGAIQADGDRLRQVLMNLAQNARAATAGRERPRLRLTSRRTADGVTLRIEDNGPGIAPEDREHVFEPYRSGTAGGLGLGLALVKGIVLAHRGRIAVEESDLGGACLRVDLPRRAPARPAAQPETEEQSPEANHE